MNKCSRSWYKLALTCGCRPARLRARGPASIRQATLTSRQVSAPTHPAPLNIFVSAHLAHKS